MTAGPPGRQAAVPRAGRAGYPIVAVITASAAEIEIAVIPGDVEALVFSRKKREPYFYQDLWRPSHHQPFSTAAAWRAIIAERKIVQSDSEDWLVP